MSKSEWEAWVNETISHVQKNPVEYLGQDLPDQKLLTDILQEIQMEFFKEMDAFQNTARILRS